MIYRSQGSTIHDGEPLDPGPAQKCECDMIARDWPMPRACSPGARVRVGLFRRCDMPGSHLHEECRACGHRWITAFAGAT